MGKKKWAQERGLILQAIVDYCELNRHVDVHQSPYKDDFVKLCADAYKRRFCGVEWGYYTDDRSLGYMHVSPKRPQVDGSTIWQYAKRAGLVTTEMDPADETYTMVRQLIDWWEAWVYAWDHQPRKRQVVHKLKRTPADG